MKQFMLMLIVGAALVACSKEDDMPDPGMQPVMYSGDFMESNDEVNTEASGDVEATFNPETMELTFNVAWQNLSTPVSAMHFHDDGPVIHGIDGWDAALSGSVSGKVTLSTEEAADLSAGKIYVQIHTETYPGGEVVALLTKDSSSGGNNNNPGGY